MTTPAEGSTGPIDNSVSTEGTGTTEPGNPAWNEVLDSLPAEFHPLVTPHFQKWDQAAQERVTKANEQLTQFDAYKPFLDHNITPEDLTQGLRYVQAIAQDPKAVWQALGEAYGLTAEQAQAVVENQGEADPYAPQFEELKQGLDVVAQFQLQQVEQRQLEEANANLDVELNSIKEKLGPNFNEGYALFLLDSGLSTEQATRAHTEFVTGLLQNNPRPFAPNVMGTTGGGGAGLPSTAIDPATMTDNETKQAVIAYLAAQQNKG